MLLDREKWVIARYTYLERQANDESGLIIGRILRTKDVSCNYATESSTRGHQRCAQGTFSLADLN